MAPPHEGLGDPAVAENHQRMYYAARGADDPVGALARKIPKHAGSHLRVTAAVATAIENQYRDHPRWTWQLHHDNLVALAKTDRALAPVPSYTTVRRFMKARGMYRIQKKRQGRAVEAEIVPRETRSYELAYVNALWHYDFPEGKRKVITTGGALKTPYLFGPTGRSTPPRARPAALCVRIPLLVLSIGSAKDGGYVPL